jgi:hypothetical protein
MLACVSIYWRGFVGAKEKTSVVLLVFNPLLWGFFKDFLFPNELGGFKILNLGLWEEYYTFSIV